MPRLRLVMATTALSRTLKIRLRASLTMVVAMLAVIVAPDVRRTYGPSFGRTACRSRLAARPRQNGLPSAKLRATTGGENRCLPVPTQPPPGMLDPMLISDVEMELNCWPRA